MEPENTESLSVSENKVDLSPSAIVNTIVANASGIYRSYNRFVVVFTDMMFSHLTSVIES